MARLPVAYPARCAVTSPSTPALTPAVPKTGPRTDASKTNGKADAGQERTGVIPLLRRDSHLGWQHVPGASMPLRVSERAQDVLHMCYFLWCVSECT